MGTNVSSAVSSMSFYGTGYRPGASLRAWRDALPNSQIFGADIDGSILFNNEERIRTARADQLDPGSLLAVYELYGVTHCRKHPQRSGAICRVRWSGDVSGARPRHVRIGTESLRASSNDKRKEGR